ncbi:MAG: SOS response-associated peptidase [Nitrospira sp.]|nr:SOS response-associated peptidase [Nitrospira sp.]
MCGRYVQDPDDEIIFFEHFKIPFEGELREIWKRRYNVAPTQFSVVVRDRGMGREAAFLRWGLVPSWAKDPAIGSRMINARSETLTEKPSFRTAFKRRRCIVPATGYYEWRKLAKGKQPYHIGLRDKAPMAFAGLWESWSTPEGDPLESYTIITCPANEATKQLHDRMPVVLAPDDYERWLAPGNEDVKALQGLLKPFADEPIVSYPVSTVVNSPRNDVPGCVERVEPEA